MTITTLEGKKLQFASSINDEECSAGLAQHLSVVKRLALSALPCFKYEDGTSVDTADLCREAMVLLGGKRKVSDRFTAMLVIAGTRYLDHPELQVPRPTMRDISVSLYAKE